MGKPIALEAIANAVAANYRESAWEARGYVRVLIVEDNARLASLVERGIAPRGFHADVASTLAQADDALRATRYDVIILDLGLPDGDGIAWLARERARVGAEIPPVLILTARAALGDRIAGLDAGADDYLVKPIDVDELAARLRALLRRPGARGMPVIRIGDLSFDVATRMARNYDVPLDLTRREADLLELLMRRAGSVVRKSVIADTLYTYDEPVTPNAIEAIASRLRQKLAAAGAVGVLTTIRGLGYILKDSRH